MTTTTEHSSDETLAAFIDGTLDEETRKSVMEHMAACEECLDVLLDSSELKREGVLPAKREFELAPVVPIRKVWRDVAVGLGAAAAVTVVVLSVWPRDAFRQMAKVAPPERRGDGRLTEFPYRERAVTYRSVEDDVKTKPEYWPFLQVIDDLHLQDKAENKPSARTLHEYGVAVVVTGKADDAVKILESALRYETPGVDAKTAIASSKDPQLLSDLAVAYIRLGRYDEALNAAEHAWALKKTPEIAWNRAAAAGLLNHRDQAIAYWNEYLRLDSKSQWADEARKNLQKLQNPDALP